MLKACEIRARQTRLCVLTEDEIVYGSLDNNALYSTVCTDMFKKWVCILWHSSAPIALSAHPLDCKAWLSA